MDFRKTLNDNKYEKKQSNGCKTEKNCKEDVTQNINKYSLYSHDELMQEFMSVTNKLKANGELDQKRLNEIYSSLSPMLSPEQQQNLKNILKNI